MSAHSADWFASGLGADLPAGLDRILRQEQSKIHFVQALRNALVNPAAHAPDQIRLLHDDVRALEKTLRLRVGLLPLDKPQAWFRSSVPSDNDKSPIASTSYHEPIFMAFEESQAMSLRQLIPEFWKQAVVATDRYNPGSSLWGRLLALNKRLHALNNLRSPFQDISLEELPDAIPDELNSPSLNQFGLQIATRIKACRNDLEASYGFLWARTESFLYAQHIQYMAQKSRNSWQAKPKDEPERPPSPPIPKRKLSPLEEALSFMSFSRLPSFSDLRHRYRAMAQALHPDRGGCEERFKLLTLHYQALLKQLQRF